MFDEYFETFLADTPESKAKHYHIRYKVYCEEMGFENKNDFSHAQEYDHWDAHSAHFIVKHKQSGRWVGAMRLISQCDQKLPIQQHAHLSDIINNQPDQCVELSRLCVLKEMRRATGNIYSLDETSMKADNIQDTDTLKFSVFHNQHLISRQIIWGLLRAASIYCYNKSNL